MVAKYRCQPLFSLTPAISIFHLPLPDFMDANAFFSSLLKEHLFTKSSLDNDAPTFSKSLFGFLTGLLTLKDLPLVFLELIGLPLTVWLGVIIIMIG